MYIPTTMKPTMPPTSTIITGSRIDVRGLIGAENVRDHRASAIFWTVTPILKGILSRNASHCGRPQEELFHLRNAMTPATVPPIRMYHCPVTTFDSATVNF